MAGTDFEWQESDPGRFVWPPGRPGVSVEAGAGGRRVEPGVMPSGLVLGRATGSGVTADCHSERAVLETAGGAAFAGGKAIGWWAGVITPIERTWLGLTSPPWSVRIAEAGWKPDAPEAYCWRCGRRVGPFEVTPPGSPEPGCSVCASRRPPWDRLVRVGDYRGVLRDAIRELKFGRWRHIGAVLGIELGRAIDRELTSAGVDRDRLALVPVPASFRRRIARGIDHTLVITRGVRRITGGRIVRALARRHRPSQLDVPPSERTRNVSGSFVPIPRRMGEIAGWTVLVIDDVMTTGATMTAACRAIRVWDRKTRDSARRPVERLWGAVAAVTPKDGGIEPSKDG